MYSSTRDAGTRLGQNYPMKGRSHWLRKEKLKTVLVIKAAEPGGAPLSQLCASLIPFHVSHHNTQHQGHSFLNSPFFVLSPKSLFSILFSRAFRSVYNLRSFHYSLSQTELRRSINISHLPPCSPNPLCSARSSPRPLK